MLGVSVCFHAGLIFFLSVTSSSVAGLSTLNDREKPLSLVNIVMLEPAATSQSPLPSLPQSSESVPRSSKPSPVRSSISDYTITEETIEQKVDELASSEDEANVEHVENYTLVMDAIDQKSNEQALQVSGMHAKSAESIGSAAQAALPMASKETSGQSAEYVKRNYDYIQRRIRDKLVYPAPARRAGIQGVAEVVFIIHEDGKVSNVSIRKSSGHEILDDAAIQTIIAAAPFPKPPAPARIAIPISFKLR
jgi:protein TonB